MNTRTAGHRVAVTLVGLLLIAAGALGLARSYGAFGAGRVDEPVIPDQFRSFAAEEEWFWWAVAAACLLVALIGLRWLLSQLRTDRVGRLDLTDDSRDGLTTLHAGALSDAVEDEARTITGVADASAHLSDRGGRRLGLRADLADYADVGTVREALVRQVVAHARQAVDDPQLPVDIELRLTSRTDNRHLA